MKCCNNIEKLVHREIHPKSSSIKSPNNLRTSKEKNDKASLRMRIGITTQADMS